MTNTIELSDFIPLASTPTCPLAAMKHSSKPFYGVQFHPEVTHTPYGTKMIENFLYKVGSNCYCVCK